MSFSLIGLAITAFARRALRWVLAFDLRLVIAVIVLGVAIAAVPLYAMHVKAERDRWWVAEIKAKSGAVLRVINEGNIELTEADAKALKELDDERERLRAGLAASQQQARTQPLSDDCRRCRIPLNRLGGM